MRARTIAALILVTALTVPAEGQCQPRWMAGDGVPGANADVNAIAGYDDGTGPALYIGGRFTLAGDADASCIARWDGSRWHALGAGVAGAGPGFGPAVNALAVYGGRLIAGGSFESAGGQATSAVAAWNGSGWMLLGPPPADVSINALAGDGRGLTAGGERPPGAGPQAEAASSA